jgi:DNA-binding NarL/FixJ family response regulator
MNLPILTPRQREIFLLSLRGFGRKNVARQMNLEQYQVRNILTEIYTKLGLRGDKTTKRMRAMLWLLIIGEIAPGDLEIHHVKRREDY